MFVVPPSPPTRVGSSRTAGAAGCGPAAAPFDSAVATGIAVRALDRELDLDAVPDDPRQGLADQRSVAGLEPVLGEPVGDGDPESLVVDVDELGVAKPRLEIGGRERNLQLSEGGAPDLLGIHMVDVDPC